jgi:hypothetical protein
MKYMFLWYCNEEAWLALSEAERQHIVASGMVIQRELEQSGKILAGAPLHAVASATTIRRRNGKPMITDGPFAETREQLGGYNLIEAKDLDEAIAIGERLNLGPVHSLEIRPVMDRCELTH